MAESQSLPRIRYVDSKFWLQRIVANNSLLDHSYPARQSQERQGGVLRSINDASIQPYQGVQGVQGVGEAVNTNQYVYQPFAPSGGVHFTSGANVLDGTPAIPATMVMEARTVNEGSSKRHYRLGLQAAGDLPRSDGLIQLEQSPEISTDAGGTAYSSWYYDFCPLGDPWATSFDVSASGPTAQAVAPQMNIVTPYTDHSHDEGGTSVGAAVCLAASSAPGPTHDIIGACGTARSGVVMCPRSPHRAMGVGYDQTHRRVPPRRATRTGLPRATRGPAVQFESDANALAARLLNEGADDTAVELLLTHIFNNEVSARALTVNSIYRKQSTGTSSTRSKYRLLLADVERKDGSKGYCCLLCPQGRRKEYKNPQDTIRHLRKAHFGIAVSCIGGWYVAISRVNHSRRRTNPATSGHLFYRQSEMNQHLKKYCQANVDGRGASARPSTVD